MPQDWTDFDSFAGIVPGLHWAYNIPYQQRLYAITNQSPLSAPGACAVLLAYSTPEGETLSQQPTLILNDNTTLPLNGTPVMAWRGWPTMFHRMVLFDYAVVPAAKQVTGVYPGDCVVMGATAFMGDTNAWQSVQPALASAASAFVQEENQRRAMGALQSNFAGLSTNQIAELPPLLPFDVPGPALVFACNTGLRNQWVALTPGQLVDSNFFNAAQFPLAFYLGDNDYVADVNTNGDGKAAVIQYLAGGGTLVVLSESAFPFSNPCDQSDNPTSYPSTNDCLLPSVGLPLFLVFTNVPAGLSVIMNTNISLPMLSSSFSLSKGGQLCLINPTNIAPGDRYAPWLSVVGTGANSSSYGDAAGCVDLARGGHIIYISRALLAGTQGQTLMADGICWLVQAALRPTLPRLDSLVPGTSHTTLGFEAYPNLAYRLESCTDLGSGQWFR